MFMKCQMKTYQLCCYDQNAFFHYVIIEFSFVQMFKTKLNIILLNNITYFINFINLSSFNNIFTLSMFHLQSFTIGIFIKDQYNPFQITFIDKKKYIYFAVCLSNLEYLFPFLHFTIEYNFHFKIKQIFQWLHFNQIKQ
ncbi:hypothetical protein RFI_34321, partial [Reticulomyxa filosa]